MMAYNSAVVAPIAAAKALRLLNDSLVSWVSLSRS
jgi:hypothetical protein